MEKRRTRVVRHFLIALAVLCGLNFLVSLIQVGYPYEEGIYGDFTVSALQDGDFNLINQRREPSFNWQTTVTGQLPTIHYPTVSAYLAPFFLYQMKVMHGLDPSRRIERGTDFLDVHDLSSLFFILLGVIFYWKVALRLGLRSHGVALALTLLGTCFVWYSVFCPTTTDIVAMTYSIAAFLYFLECRDSPSRVALFTLGLAAGLGAVLRIELCWIFVLWFQYLLELRGKERLRAGAWGALGALVPLACYLAYRSLHSYGWIPPQILLLAENDPLAFGQVNFPYALFGPNGYLSNFPVFLALGASALAAYRHRSGSARYSLALFGFPLALMLSYTLGWLLADGLQGRHQLTFLFLFALPLAEALDRLRAGAPKLFRAALWIGSACVIWSLYVQVCFVYADFFDYPKWHFEFQLTLSRFLAGLGMIAGAFSGDRLLRSAKLLLLLLPLLLALAWMLAEAWKRESLGLKRVLQSFFWWGGAGWLLLSGLNLYWNPRNVELHQKEGLYAGKVVIQGAEASFYDDKIEVYRISALNLFQHGRCDLVKKLDKITANYLRRVRDDIRVDPIGFREQLALNKLRPSPLELPWVLERLAEHRKDCPLE